MKARHAILVVLAAAVTLASVAAAGPDAAKQRVVINMKIHPQGTFVLTPLQAGPLEGDSGKISSNWQSIPGRKVMRDGQEVTIYDGAVTTLTGKARNPHDSRPERVGRSRVGRRHGCHRHLEGRARDRPVRRDRRQGAEWPCGPR